MRFSYNKYHNHPTYINGIRFASKREASRYQLLKILANDKVIKDLKLQPRFKMPPGFTYVADFSYTKNGKQIIEDVKGVMTDVFKLKAKCFKYFYPALELILIK